MIRDFASVMEALATQRRVTTGRMFGSEALKLGNRVFAMVVKGRLVVKVSPDRAKELQESGLASAFDPGHGRLMKQWVSIQPRAKIDWIELAGEALAYARG